MSCSLLFHDFHSDSSLRLRSSYGSVYKARDKRDGKTVAIKVRTLSRWWNAAYPWCFCTWQILEVDKDSTRELQKEINILKECHSEYVVAYYGSYEEKTNIWVRTFAASQFELISDRL